MVELKLGEVTYELATTLRVVYALRDITNAKNLQGAINSISDLDLEGQISLLYAAYKAGGGKTAPVSKTVFEDAVLDNLGIFAITNVVNELTDGLLYAGLSPEEKAVKKAIAEEAVAAVGATSSAQATD